MTELLLRGEIVFDEVFPSLTDAVLHLYIEDTTLADASARVIVYQKIALLSAAALSLTLHVPLPDPRADYTLRVLIDLDGDGQIGRGDFINTVNYPVPADGSQDYFVLHVRKVSP